MELIFKHIWILFILTTFLNVFILKQRTKKFILEKPELRKGYDKYLSRWLIIGNIPWVIIGVGNTSGMTNSIFEYLMPRLMNPIVLVFHFAIVVLWVLAIRWVYFKGGAEFIESHPGLARKTSLSGNTNMTAKQVKIFLPLAILGGVVGMVVMWTANFH